MNQIENMYDNSVVVEVKTSYSETSNTTTNNEISYVNNGSNDDIGISIQDLFNLKLR